MHSIKRDILEDVLQASKNTFPDEFFSLLGGDRKTRVIDEFIVVPAEYGRDSVTIKQWLVPFDSRILGSVHSHPNAVAFPSRADLRSFAGFGEIHLITFPPFALNSFAAFLTNGKRAEVNVVD